MHRELASGVDQTGCAIYTGPACLNPSTVVKLANFAITVIERDTVVVVRSAASIKTDLKK
jgi:hypothetical protein